MKRTLLLLVMVFAVNIICSQEKTTWSPTHEFFVGYGISPFKNSLPETEFCGSSSLGNKAILENLKISNAFSVGYSFYLSKKWAVGLTYSQTSTETGAKIYHGDTYDGKVKSNLRSIMFTTKYIWLQVKGVSFYSRAGLGSTIMKNDIELSPSLPDYTTIDFEEKNGVAWQVMPVGIEWAFVKNLAIFAEGGIGVEGIGLGGIKLRF